MYNYIKFSNAPDIVRQLCMCFDAFIVGGAAKYLLDKSEIVNDWDIIVPLSKWGSAQKLIPKNAMHNTFGGSKIKYVDCCVDVWSMDLSEFLIANKDRTVCIIHPKSLFSGEFDYGFSKNV